MSARIAGRLVVVATTPVQPGRRVVLQTYDREHFTFVEAARAKLDARGAARLALPAALPAHLRVVVRGGGGWSDGRSRVLLVRH